MFQSHMDVFYWISKKNGGCTVADSHDEHLPIMIRDIKNEHGKI